MKLLKAGFGLILAAFSLVWTPRAEANNAGAVVLVNSTSARYADFQHFIQPYLGNFGVPYTVLDISSNAVGTNIASYALIIIGHAQLDTNHAFLNSASQSNISAAVFNGAGLVNFDNVLSVSNTPSYQFVQDIFGFGYQTNTAVTNLAFPPTEAGSQLHYLTSLHPTNDALILSNSINFTKLVLTSNEAAVVTSGGGPFVAITKYGQGRAVQWASADWMSAYVLGPVNGLDDVMWRGFVWAARKPFVMRGMKPFATMRVDDAWGSGGFWWVYDANKYGFKPYIALFVSAVATGDIPYLRTLVTNGNATTSIHSFTCCNFFYFDDANKAPYSDAVMSNNFAQGTAWHTNNGIPISKMMIAHWSEIGPNAFAGLKAWGIEYVLLEVEPGTLEYYPPYPPWLMLGPYRLYETPLQGQSVNPMVYADYLPIPGHPEFNGQFFDPYTEIRNVSPLTANVTIGGDWAPTNDVAGSVARGVAQIKHGLDSLTMGNVFTHETYISGISEANWLAILQGVSNGLAAYNPSYVTMDFANQYLRATRTSQITSADFNPFTGQVTATLTGKTDLPINVYVYTGANSSISNSPGTVPVFTGTTNVTVGSLPVSPATLLVTADPTNRLYETTNPILTYTITGFQGADTVAVVTGSAGLSTTATTNSPVGTYPIAITNINLSSSNYNFAFSNGTLTVNPATLLVSANPTNRQYETTNPALTYTITGFQGADTVAVVTGSAGLSTTATTNSPVGTHPIATTNINLSASNYTFTFASNLLTVNPATLLVSADPKNRLYGTANPLLTYTTSGFLGTDTVAVVTGSAGLSTTATINSPVGTYPIAITNINLSATNYTFTFTSNSLTVNPATLLVSADPKGRLYGTANPLLTYTTSGFQGTDTVAVVTGNAGLSTTAVSNSPVGTYPIAITNINLSATNYHFAFATNSLTVNPATLLVRANDQNRPYGATNPVLTYSMSGFLGTDSATVVAGNAGLSTVATTNSQVGTYPIAVTNINLSATNYNFTFTNGTLTVGRVALLVTADNQSRTYWTTNPVLTYSMSGFVGTDTVAVVSGGAALSTTAATNSQVGTYPITITNLNLGATNYSFSFSNGWLTVNRATLLVSADNQSRPYGATNPVLTYTMNGYLGSDNEEVVSGEPAMSTVAGGTSPVGTYAIVATNGNLAATNYTFVFSNGTLTVTATAPVILSITESGASNMVITWSALSNATYRVRFVNDLGGTNWQSLAPDVRATSNTASKVDNTGGATRRFYQVIVP